MCDSPTGITYRPLLLIVQRAALASTHHHRHERTIDGQDRRRVGWGVGRLDATAAPVAGPLGGRVAEVTDRIGVLIWSICGDQWCPP
jgi:hypothetical protein